MPISTSTQFSQFVTFATGAKSELDIIHVDDTLSVCGGIQVTRP